MNQFENIGISSNLLKSLKELGYETPSPIQEKSIPLLLEGEDILAQAQTGTGKTAAFALPILMQLDINLPKPQALILTPTRELAIQVAESLQSYAKYLPGFHVLPVYGGQDFRPQLRALKRGVQVVVGTPGRVMDHMDRGTLCLKQLKKLVLDEADEMLNMGFKEDVEWILEKTPAQRQTALFSATMPTAIKRVADTYLQDAIHIKIKTKTTTVAAIKQYYMQVSKYNKLEALTRFLEIEPIDSAIIFTRTKLGSSEIADKLSARGYAAAAINGDMKQELREKVIQKIKKGKLDIVVATDVAARGIDVERLSHVINYDVPYDPESYVHRIGRTGRAGREGVALLLLTHKEQRMLRDIERTTKQKLTALTPPTVSELNEKRLEKFTSKIFDTLTGKDLDFHRDIIQKIVHDSEHSELDVAAALAYMSQKDSPLRLSQDAKDVLHCEDEQRQRSSSQKNPADLRKPEAGMTRCRIAVGFKDQLQPRDVVGFIANRADVRSKVIGQIHIFNTFSFVDIADDVVEQVIRLTYRDKLKRRQFAIKVADEHGGGEARRRPKRRKKQRAYSD